MRSREAFTLIELMIVVVIIAVVAGAIAPSVGAAVRNRKQSAATQDVVRSLRAARSSAAGYGRAYAVRFDSEGADGQGTLEVRRGDNNRCNGSTDWSAVAPAVGLGYSPLRHGAGDDFTIVLAAEGGETVLELCYEPSGATTWREGSSGRFASSAPSEAGRSGGFGFTITRHADGAAEGVTRRVVAPFGGDARIAR